MIGRNTRRAIGLALACAAVFAASGALAQRTQPIMRVTPQPQAQPSQTNPQLQMSGAPQLYTVDTIKLEARVKQLEQRLIQQHDQIATQQQQISALIVQLGNTQNREAALEAKFEGHKHQMGFTVKPFESVTCITETIASKNFTSCKPASPPEYNYALSIGGPESGKQKFNTTGPIQ